MRDAELVEAFLGQVHQRFGRVDVLVNNAGGGFRAGFLDLSVRGEDTLMRKNFSSVTSFIRATVPLMTRGSIVTITSIEAYRAAPGYAVYAAMKAALDNLTRSLALELGERMIRVNAVAAEGGFVT